jgi:DNA repair protein RecN (Recombination protein N)
MLKKLLIQNYAIIEEIEIDFGTRLNVITGETGAGKSILMGALSLILGDRADGSILLNRERKCIVEGIFEWEKGKSIQELLEFFELDLDDLVTIRREISPNGKSRAFVNDTPVNLDQLRALASHLVDLHQQFDNLSLGRSEFQRNIIDALSNHHGLLSKYRSAYESWKKAELQLTTLEAQKSQATREFDYNQFLFDELNDAHFVNGELENLDTELKLLSHAEGIKSVLEKIIYDFREHDKHVLQQIKMAITPLQSYSSYHSALPGLTERLQSVHIELKDIVAEIETVNEQIHYDTKKIEQINDRLALGYKLLKKHGFQKTSELIELRAQLEKKLSDVLNLDDQIQHLRLSVENLYQVCLSDAKLISNNRKLQLEPLCKKINYLLSQVGMPNAKMKINMEEVQELSHDGQDEIEFLFDANKSNRFEKLSKVASGGELSRLMLCIKSLVAQSIDLPTLIFDEIDSGISGEAAKQVGILLKGLATSRQVICITHQPQIAGRGDEHFLVYKMVEGDKVKTRIRLLSKEERIASIAEMLSGAKPTAAALQNAREMVTG